MVLDSHVGQAGAVAKHHMDTYESLKEEQERLQYLLQQNSNLKGRRSYQAVTIKLDEVKAKIKQYFRNKWNKEQSV